jgi:hypothetical protein
LQLYGIKRGGQGPYNGVKEKLKVPQKGRSVGSAAAKTRLPGLKDNSVTLEFNQDFATGGPEITINAVGASLVGTSVPIVIKPTSGAVSATNPSFAFTAVCSVWLNVQCSVGELSTVSATWPISGAITKAVA